MSNNLERVDRGHAGRRTTRRRQHPSSRARRYAIRRRGCRPGCGRSSRRRSASSSRLVGRTARTSRVPERLEVQQDHVGVRILLPVLEQVVAAHVGLVPDRHERRDPKAELRDPASNSIPSAPDCEENAIRPGVGTKGANVAFMSRRIRVDDPHAVGADEPHPVATCELDELARSCRRASSRAPKPGRNDRRGHEHLLAATGAQLSGTFVAWNGHDSEVDCRRERW